MRGGRCDGWVRTLRDQLICYTGKVLIDGAWTTRDKCAERARLRGADWKNDFSQKITLVVHGDLASQAVTDPRRQYSKKLVGAARERDRGYHVCVVDADGFSDLLAGHPARCRELRRVEGSSEKVLVLPQPGDGVLGGPLQRHAVGKRDSTPLALDLSRLDEGTKAHEATLTALIRRLGARGIEVCGPARNAPLFDAGWVCDDEVFIAEVKSLSETNEDQQIRLGIGQILDYAHQLQHLDASHKIRPVLVLERQPTGARWRGVADSSGILLIWGPIFEGY